MQTSRRADPRKSGELVSRLKTFLEANRPDIELFATILSILGNLVRFL